MIENVKEFPQQHMQESVFELMKANQKLWEEKMCIGYVIKILIN